MISSPAVKRYGLPDDSDSDSSYASDSDEDIHGLYSPPDKLTTLFIESLVNDLPRTTAKDQVSQPLYLQAHYKSKSTSELFKERILVDTSK